MQPVIELKNVSKFYGTAVGVENVTLTVPEGSVFGFLGPNGAGKTTTISMLVNLIKPSAGAINIFGKDNQIDQETIRSKIGFLSSDMALDNGLTGWQQLEYFGNLRGNFDKKYVQELAKRLDCKLTKKFKALSRGNRQKVGLIAALMHRPKLLVLDEPTSGLDPLIQSEFDKIILKHKQAGGSVFISSHVLSEVQGLCDRVAFIKAGRLITSQPLGKITAAAPKVVRIVSDKVSLLKKLQAFEGVGSLRSSTNTMHFTYSGDPSDLLALALKYKVADITIQEADLETIFMRYYGDA